ncbi:AMP-binding protein [Lachnospiraceae bacterium 42-17]|jgi:long-chain acyl-CoA synthetase|nr:AMP-binding protein [Dorea sp.]
MGIFNDIEKYQNRPAIISGGKEISYETLTEHTEKIAKAVGGRCLVFLVCSNIYPALAGYVSFLQNDIVPLMINHTMKKEMFERLVETYQPRYIWQPVGFSNGKSIYEFEGYELVRRSCTEYLLDDELALLLTTSGSTGSPKYVRQSYKNILSNSNSIIDYLDINSNDRAITTLPMSYTYGLSIINTHLLQGASIILTEEPIMQKAFWELCRKYKANNFGGVPYTYEMLKKLHFSKIDLPSLRYITQAGGKLGKELHSEFAEICRNKGIKLIVMYGQTEATARMSWLPWEKTKEKSGSIGIAIPGGKFSLIDVNGEVITASHVTGELIYQGDNVTLGYAMSCNDLALPDEHKGVLETGDMAYIDNDGYYYIAGRKKRFLKVYGNRLNLDEMDSMLQAAGYEAVTSGEDNHVKIYAVNGTEEEIIGFVIEKTGLSKNAFQVIKIQQIPRSESGKILYTELK